MISLLELRPLELAWKCLSGLAPCALPPQSPELANRQSGALRKTDSRNTHLWTTGDLLEAEASAVRLCQCFRKKMCEASQLRIRCPVVGKAELSDCSWT